MCDQERSTLWISGRVANNYFFFFSVLHCGGFSYFM